MEKAGLLLAGLQEDQLSLLRQEQWWKDLPASTPKISKGENYLGLPYLVLDHPRIFGTQDVFAIRTFFWWGHFFSTTLQLSGKFKSRFEPILHRSFERLKEQDFFVCIADTPWHYHVGADNYRSAAAFTLKEYSSVVAEKPFFKLSKAISLGEWNEAPVKLLEIFSQLLAVLRT